jgi:hypothetical protein
MGWQRGDGGGPGYRRRGALLKGQVGRGWDLCARVLGMCWMAHKHFAKCICRAPGGGDVAHRPRRVVRVMGIGAVGLVVSNAERVQEINEGVPVESRVVQRGGEEGVILLVTPAPSWCCGTLPRPSKPSPPSSKSSKSSPVRSRPLRWLLHDMAG